MSLLMLKTILSEYFLVIKTVHSAQATPEGHHKTIPPEKKQDAEFRKTQNASQPRK